MTGAGWKSAFVVGGAAVLFGCASGKGSSRPDGPGAGTDTSIHQPPSGKEQVAKFDLNHDQQPDLWTYSVADKTEDGRPIDRVTRKELDLNRDGKIDLVKFYDAQARVERESMDLDFDGRVDQTNFYEKTVVVRKERDRDFDSRVDLWVFYEKGKLARKEADSNGDGRVDYWEYWEGDAVDRIGEDLDGDGNVDRWTKNPESQN